MKMYKRIFGVLLCLCMLLGAVSLASAEEDGATTGGGTGTGENTGHSHALCAGTTCTDPEHIKSGNHGSVTFAKKLHQEGGTLYIDEAEWTYDSSWDGYMLGAEIYYLGTDLTLDHGIKIKNSGGEVILCLNGNTITYTGSGAVMQIKAQSKNITFTLCNCKDEGMITHASGSGSGVNVENSGNDINSAVAKFIMYNGCITQNGGSGVYLNTNTALTMYGGSITKNNANQYGCGGGVYVGSGVTFTMYGGAITDNTASTSGGGVYAASTANFTMYGGNITGNYANNNGGGVYASGTMTIGGNVNISGNWKGEESSISNNNANNVYLSANSTITIEKPLTGENSSIGVTTATSVATTPNASIKIAAGKDKYVITDEDKGHFTPDAGTTHCNVEQKTDGLYLTHVHSGGTATCTTKATCDGCGQPYGTTLDHSYSTEWSHDGTYHWHECSYCKAKDAEVSHTYDQEVVASGYLKTEATCKQYAVYYKSCICGAKGTETFADKSGDYASHVYDDTTWGYKDKDGHAHLCQTEGCNEHDTIVAHSGGTATCKTRATCTDCHQEYGTLNLTNHTGSLSTDWRGKDDNKHWQVWSCCGAQDKNEVEAHKGTKWTDGEVTTPPTCMTAGVRTYTCEVCGKVKTEEIPAKGHDFKNGDYLSNDTQHWKQCKNCTAISEKTNHTEVTDEAKPATTTETGLTEGKHCGVCGKVLVAQEVTPKLPRYYYNSATTATKDTTKKDTTKSPGTFDPGVGVYALTAVLSVTGMAWVGRKKH